MKRTTTYRVNTTNRAEDLAALFDMLRYEGASIVDWSVGSREPGRAGLVNYVITIRSERYEPRRWQSFAVRTEVVS